MPQAEIREVNQSPSASRRIVGTTVSEQSVRANETLFIESVAFSRTTVSSTLARLSSGAIKHAA